MHASREDALNEKNIVLIGFMGVGKTTIGKMIAHRLHREFIDIDREIEQHYGMTIPQVFKQFGEPHFRQTEKNIVQHYCSDTDSKVISLGGGAFMQEEIRNLCLSTSIVLHLDLTFETWKDRFHQLIDSRPLLQNKSLEEIEELFNKRREVYVLGHSTIHTDHMEPEEIAKQICSRLRSAAG